MCVPERGLHNIVDLIDTKYFKLDYNFSYLL